MMHGKLLNFVNMNGKVGIYGKDSQGYMPLGDRMGRCLENYKIIGRCKCENMYYGKYAWTNKYLLERYLERQSWERLIQLGKVYSKVLALFCFGVVILLLCCCVFVLLCCCSGVLLYCCIVMWLTAEYSIFLCQTQTIVRKFSNI